jgi:Glycosyl hydrolase family 76
VAILGAVRLQLVLKLHRRIFNEPAAARVATPPFAGSAIKHALALFDTEPMPAPARVCPSLAFAALAAVALAALVCGQGGARASQSRNAAGPLNAPARPAVTAAHPRAVATRAGAARPAATRAGAARAAGAAAYLQLAESGVVRAQRLWRDRRAHWYDSTLHDRDRYPLATIWDAVPLFEALDAIDIAAPTPAHHSAVVAFVNGAERYYDRGLGPVAGYAPYPGDRGRATAWFDDNGWWGLAFLDAYRATGSRRYLRDAQRAFSFIATRGWNASGGGGLWWNTAHAYIAGEPLAAGSLLGALLFKLTGAVAYREDVLGFLNWADAHFVSERGLYKRTSFDPTPTPYIEGTLVEAHQVLCEAGVGQTCTWARALAGASYERFADRLNMGPQFDTIYLHWMLLYGAQTGDGRWRALALQMAAGAQAHARDARGLFLRGWDGTPITEHQARPNMLQSDAATLELFAWLAAVS